MNDVLCWKADYSQQLLICQEVSWFRHGWIQGSQMRGHQDLISHHSSRFQPPAAVLKSYLLEKIGEPRAKHLPNSGLPQTHVANPGNSYNPFWSWCSTFVKWGSPVPICPASQDFCENQWGCGTGTVLSMVPQGAELTGKAGLCISEAWQLGLRLLSVLGLKWMNKSGQSCGQWLFCYKLSDVPKSFFPSSFPFHPNEGERSEKTSADGTCRQDDPDQTFPPFELRCPSRKRIGWD